MLNTSHEDVKTDENYGPHFGVESEKGLKAVKTKPATSTLKLQLKTRKKIQGLYLLSLLYSVASPDNYLKSVVENFC